jgi:hypothetical protein
MGAETSDMMEVLILDIQTRKYAAHPGDVMNVPTLGTCCVMISLFGDPMAYGYSCHQEEVPGRTRCCWKDSKLVRVERSSWFFCAARISGQSLHHRVLVTVSGRPVLKFIMNA